MNIDGVINSLSYLKRGLHCEWAFVTDCDALFLRRNISLNYTELPHSGIPNLILDATYP